MFFLCVIILLSMYLIMTTPHNSFLYFLYIHNNSLRRGRTELAPIHGNSLEARPTGRSSRSARSKPAAVSNCPTETGSFVPSEISTPTPGSTSTSFFGGRTGADASSNSNSNPVDVSGGSPPRRRAPPLPAGAGASAPPVPKRAMSQNSRRTTRSRSPSSTRGSAGLEVVVGGGSAHGDDSVPSTTPLPKLGVGSRFDGLFSGVGGEEQHVEQRPQQEQEQQDPMPMPMLPPSPESLKVKRVLDKGEPPRATASFITGSGGGGDVGGGGVAVAGDVSAAVDVGGMNIGGVRQDEVAEEPSAADSEEDIPLPLPAPVRRTHHRAKAQQQRFSGGAGSVSGAEPPRRAMGLANFLSARNSVEVEADVPSDGRPPSLPKRGGVRGGLANANVVGVKRYAWASVQRQNSGSGAESDDGNDAAATIMNTHLNAQPSSNRSSSRFGFSGSRRSWGLGGGSMESGEDMGSPMMRILTGQKRNSGSRGGNMTGSRRSWGLGAGSDDSGDEGVGSFASRIMRNSARNSGRGLVGVRRSWGLGNSGGDSQDEEPSPSLAPKRRSGRGLKGIYSGWGLGSSMDSQEAMDAPMPPQSSGRGGGNRRSGGTLAGIRRAWGGGSAMDDEEDSVLAESVMADIRAPAGDSGVGSLKGIRSSWAESMGYSEEEMIYHSQSGAGIQIDHTTGRRQVGINLTRTGRQEVALHQQQAQEHEQAMHERATYEQAMNQHAIHEQEMYEQAMNQHAMHEQAKYEQAMNQHAMKQQSMHQQGVYEQAMNEHAMHEQAMYEKAMNQHAINQQAMHQQGMSQQAINRQENSGGGRGAKGGDVHVEAGTVAAVTAADNPATTNVPVPLSPAPRAQRRSKPDWSVGQSSVFDSSGSSSEEETKPRGLRGVQVLADPGAAGDGATKKSSQRGKTASAVSRKKSAPRESAIAAISETQGGNTETPNRNSFGVPRLETLEGMPGVNKQGDDDFEYDRSTNV